MYHIEHQIARAEFTAFQAKLNRPPVEGATVQVPNVLDRIAYTLRRFAVTVRQTRRGTPLLAGSAPAK